jgi:hypothetical protein
MKGNELLWAKILIDNQISEEVEVYKYLWNTVSSYGNMGLENKINSFNIINESTRR